MRILVWYIFVFILEDVFEVGYG